MNPPILQNLNSSDTCGNNKTCQNRVQVHVDKIKEPMAR